MAAPPEAVPIQGASVEQPTRMRVQFFVDGPFGPIETLSVVFFDASGAEQETIVLGGEHPQYELWTLLASMASSHEARQGTQLSWLPRP